MYVMVKDPELPAGLVARFEKVSWQVLRPGVEAKRVKFKGITFETRRFTCQDCSERPHATTPLASTPVLHDILWRKLYPKSGVACVPCIEARLGRRIRKSDLRDVPVNAGWLRNLAP